VVLSQRYPVALQLLDTEQLRAQQLGILLVTQHVACAFQESEPSDDYKIFLVGSRDDQRKTRIID
jgi:hypothetical protein